MTYGVSILGRTYFCVNLGYKKCFYVLLGIIQLGIQEKYHCQAYQNTYFYDNIFLGIQANNHIRVT